VFFSKLDTQTDTPIAWSEVEAFAKIFYEPVNQQAAWWLAPLDRG
jgi:hypothetical protein